MTFIYYLLYLMLLVIPTVIKALSPDSEYTFQEAGLFGIGLVLCSGFAQIEAYIKRGK